MSVEPADRPERDRDLASGSAAFPLGLDGFRESAGPAWDALADPWRPFNPTPSSAERSLP
jgi:hypothetical protein